MGELPSQRIARKRQARNAKLARVDSILGPALRRFGLEEKIQEYQFVLYWRDAVGDEIAKRTHPEKIQNGKLIVRVDSSPWAQELGFQKATLLRRLSEYMGEGVKLRDIVFYVR